MSAHAVYFVMYVGYFFMHILYLVYIYIYIYLFFSRSATCCVRSPPRTRCVDWCSALRPHIIKPKNWYNRRGFRFYRQAGSTQVCTWRALGGRSVVIHTGSQKQKNKNKAWKQKRFSFVTLFILLYCSTSCWSVGHPRSQKNTYSIQYASLVTVLYCTVTLSIGRSYTNPKNLKTKYLVYTVLYIMYEVYILLRWLYLFYCYTFYWSVIQEAKSKKFKKKNTLYI